MCGIAGIIVGNAGRVDICSISGQMQARLNHRGPDDHGLVALDNKRCVLAHTRLSILDLSSAGHQPMSTPDGRYWITYNGEVYNYQELRKELEGDRFPTSISHVRSAVSQPNWYSNSDTEVILHAYARWGHDSLTKLRGMFAFAIWDSLKEELIIGRDSLGIKPLYYYQTDNFLIFASEVRSLLASGLVPRSLSVEGLESYLQFGAVQDPLTIVTGVHSLLPGQYLVVQHKNDTDSLSVAVHHYPRTTNIVPKPETRPQAATVLRGLLEESVCRHLVSDVPVGAFLSGGIDSSAIVALMCQVANHRPRTFTVVFKESEFSEALYARLAAKRFGTDHREIMLCENDLLELLPSAFQAMDQPTIDGVNTFVVSKAVKEAGMTVVLSGLGGDELFAGYPSFRRARQLQQLGITPPPIRRLVSLAGRSIFNGSARRKKIWDMVDSDCSPYAAYAISRRVFASVEITALARAQGLEGRDPSPMTGNQKSEMTDFEKPNSALPDSDVINAVSSYELQGYMANTLLRDTDQMSMAHALEVRVPFVDRLVAGYVLDLPGRWKLRGTKPKPLLLDALGDLLPEKIWRRPKKGFTLPFQRWMQSGLRSEMTGVLSNRKEMASLGLNADAVRATWDAFTDNPIQEPWSRSWALYVLTNWCRINHVSAA